MNKVLTILLEPNIRGAQVLQRTLHNEKLPNLYYLPKYCYKFYG